MKYILGAVLVSSFVLAFEAHGAPAKAYNIRMRRTDMPDVTDVQSVLNSILTGGETDREKAKAIWRVVFQYSHQDTPPQEKLAGCTHDAMKLFNVYGYRMCCCASECVETLGKAAGFADGRTMQITAHNVSELYWGGAWHMIDSSLICYFKWGSGVIASVDDIHFNQGTLIAQTACPTAIYGGSDWFPAETHRLSNATSEYTWPEPPIDGRGSEAADGYSNGWSVGYKALLTLREGETLVRSCTNDGNQEHVNKDGGGAPGCRTLFGGTGSGAYFNRTIPDQGGTYYYVHPDYHGGVVGNGTLTYAPELAGGGYRGGMESETNLACTADDGQSPGVHLASAGTGTLIIRMQCPYIFLDGSVNLTFARSGAGQLKVHISTNNMLDWHEIHSTSSSGTFNIPTGSYVYRRYSYYLKFELSGGSPTDAGLNSLSISNLVQHAQRAMPFLVQGDNEIVVGAGSATSTVTIEPRVTTSTVSPSFTQNETLTTMHAVIENATVTDGGVWDDWSSGMRVTIPVSTPGDMTALRFGGVFRMRDAGDSMAFEVSTTGPTSGFAEVHSIQGLDVKCPEYIEYTGLPAGTRNAWVRFQRKSIANTLGISGHLRIDADYTEAGATQLPFKIKHEWTESSVPKEHTEVVTTTPHTYHINCAAEPTMTALTTSVDSGPVELPPNCTIFADLTTIIEGNQVVFTAQASDPGGTIDLYEWDYDGDGTYDESTGTNPTVTHQFDTPGTFQVTVRVTDNDLMQATDSIEIVVWADSDSDGLPDWWEMQYFDDLDEGASGDPDGDALLNQDEYDAGTNPDNEDTDGDGILDGADSDPLNQPAPFHGIGGCGGAVVSLIALGIFLGLRRRNR